MRYIQIKITRQDTEAFKSNPYELADILERISRELRQGQGLKTSIEDSNGEVVGYRTGA